METIQYPTEVKANKEHNCNFCTFKIEKGNSYFKSVHKIDEVYTWKTHSHCKKISEILAMYDNCDEGVTTYDFIENIKSEYNDLMLTNNYEIYTNKDFIVPSFQDRLNFVLVHYNLM